MQLSPFQNNIDKSIVENFIERWTDKREYVGKTFRQYYIFTILHYKAIIDTDNV